MRISRTAGRGMKKSLYNWGVVQCLIPGWDLVRAYRSGSLSQDEYGRAYIALLQERWSEVRRWLESLDPEEDLTLLCHERDGQFCHRWIVADLVRRHRPDVDVVVH